MDEKFLVHFLKEKRLLDEAIKRGEVPPLDLLKRVLHHGVTMVETSLKEGWDSLSQDTLPNYAQILLRSDSLLEALQNLIEKALSNLPSSSSIQSATPSLPDKVAGSVESQRKSLREKIDLKERLLEQHQSKLKELENTHAELQRFSEHVARARTQVFRFQDDIERGRRKYSNARKRLEDCKSRLEKFGWIHPADRPEFLTLVRRELSTIHELKVGPEIKRFLATDFQVSFHDFLDENCTHLILQSSPSTVQSNPAPGTKKREQGQDKVGRKRQEESADVVLGIDPDTWEFRDAGAERTHAEEMVEKYVDLMWSNGDDRCFYVKALEVQTPAHLVLVPKPEKDLNEEIRVYLEDTGQLIWPPIEDSQLNETELFYRELGDGSWEISPSKVKWYADLSIVKSEPPSHFLRDEENVSTDEDEEEYDEEDGSSESSDDGNYQDASSSSASSDAEDDSSSDSDHVRVKTEIKQEVHDEDNFSPKIKKERDVEARYKVKQEPNNTTGEYSVRTRSNLSPKFSVDALGPESRRISNAKSNDINVKRPRHLDDGQASDREQDSLEKGDWKRAKLSPTITNPQPALPAAMNDESFESKKTDKDVQSNVNEKKSDQKMISPTRKNSSSSSSSSSNNETTSSKQKSKRKGKAGLSAWVRGEFERIGEALQFEATTTLKNRNATRALFKRDFQRAIQRTPFGKEQEDGCEELATLLEFCLFEACDMGCVRRSGNSSSDSRLQDYVNKATTVLRLIEAKKEIEIRGTAPDSLVHYKFASLNEVLVFFHMEDD